MKSKLVKDYINSDTWFCKGNNMYHYIYKVTSPSGKFYIGRHSSKHENDNYMGSGKWVRSIKDKTTLKKEILYYVECFDNLLLKEEELIKQYIDDPSCMNFNNSSIGFSSGSRNPNTLPENKEKCKERVTGNKNPMYGKKPSQDTINKIRAKAIGRKPSEETRRKISEAVSKGRQGIKYSMEGKQKLSKARKLEYVEGTRLPPSFKGNMHTEKYKTEMRKLALNRQSIKCEHCNESFKPHTFKRWHGPNCKKII